MEGANLVLVPSSASTVVVLQYISHGATWDRSLFLA